MPLTVGTAGHIDHGKTWLVRALTGKDTDRLPEEQARGISIDLGYAPLELPDGRRLSLVDVPGHERFVRTMIAGATGIDLFLLVIDAQEGARPQTHEHLAVLRLLGVEHGVVAVTKSDAVDEETLELAVEEAHELVPNAEVVAVSAKTGAGLDELRAALARVPVTERDRASAPRGSTSTACSRCTASARSRPARSGRERSPPATSCASSRAAEVCVCARVQVHDAPVERAEAGQRVAVNLPTVERRELARGDVLVEPGHYPALVPPRHRARRARRHSRGRHRPRRYECSARACRARRPLRAAAPRASRWSQRAATASCCAPRRRSAAGPCSIPRRRGGSTRERLAVARARRPGRDRRACSCTRRSRAASCRRAGSSRRPSSRSVSPPSARPASTSSPSRGSTSCAQAPAAPRGARRDAAARPRSATCRAAARRAVGARHPQPARARAARRRRRISRARRAALGERAEAAAELEARLAQEEIVKVDDKRARRVPRRGGQAAPRRRRVSRCRPRSTTAAASCSHRSTRSRCPGSATRSASAAAPRSCCSSATTRTGSRYGSATGACCVARAGANVDSSRRDR